MDIDAIREKFKKDIYATESTGAVIDEVGENYAVCSLDLNGSHRNAVGAVMGGVMFTLADFAFAVAANSGGRTVVTLTSSISFISGVKGKRMIEDAVC